LNYRNGITLYFVTLLHSVNVKAMLITLHCGLMTEDGINRMNKKGIFIFSAAIFIYAASITFEIKVNIPLRYVFSFSYVCVCVCLCPCPLFGTLLSHSRRVTKLPKNDCQVRYVSTSVCPSLCTLKLGSGWKNYLEIVYVMDDFTKLCQEYSIISKIGQNSEPLVWGKIWI
jgi:hypothetical protein